MKAMPTLVTERLVLRPFRPDDAADVQRLAGDRAIADTTLNIPHPYEDGMAEEWISKHQDAFDEGAQVALAITRKSDGSLVGGISLMSIAAGHKAALGYWIGKEYWNHGFCSEAGRALLRYAFTELALLKVYALYFVRNPASGRVLGKLGMSKEGTLRKHVKKWDTYEDVVVCGILKEEWEESVSPPVSQPQASTGSGLPNF